MPLPDGVILGIETSNPSAATPGCGWSPGVALARCSGGRLERLGEEAVRAGAAIDDDLVAAIDRVCRGSGVGARDLRGVAVSVGPGGFTAVRMATAVGKMIAEVTGAAAFAVPSAWVAARRAGSDAPFAVALASKNGSAWVTRFAGGRAGEGRLEDAAIFDPRGLAALFADRFLPVAFAEACAIAGVEIRPPRFEALAVIEAAADVGPIDPAGMLPLYPREPEAVTKWRALGRG